MQYEVVVGLVGDVEVDDPVHEVEADEAHGEPDARVFVDVGGSAAVEFVQTL